MLDFQIQMRTKETAEQRWLKRLREDARSGKARLQVGIIDALPHSGAPGMSVADIGATHELGAGNIPARSWLMGFFNDKQADAERMLEAAARQSFSQQKGLEHMLETFGVLLVSGIRKRMVAGIGPALAPFTLKLRQARGVTRTTPLIDTAQFLNSIGIRVFGKKKNVP